MSDNISMIQGAYEAFGRGDIPALMENFSDDIEWHSPEPLPQHIDARGPDQVGQFFQAVADNWSDLQVDVDDIVASGDRVCAIGHAEGKLNGGDAEYGFVHAWTVRDGKLARFDEYVAPSGALLAH
jgi:ketosteroid isomerase-like protein